MVEDLSMMMGKVGCLQQEEGATLALIALYIFLLVPMSTTHLMVVSLAFKSQPTVFLAELVFHQNLLGYRLVLAYGHPCILCVYYDRKEQVVQYI